MIARVYIKTGSLNIDKPFDYLIPSHLEGKVCVGARVKVPFGGGNLPREAYVTELCDSSSFDSLKEIRSVSDSLPVLTQSAVSLCFYMRERYFCTFSEAASLMTPPGTETKFEEWISLSHKFFEKDTGRLSVRQKQAMQVLSDNEGSAEMTQLKNVLGKSTRTIINSLIDKGIAEKSFRDKRRANEKTVRLAYYCGEEDINYYISKLEKSSPRQSSVLCALAEYGELSVPDIITLSGATRNAVEALFAKGLVNYREAEILRNPLNEKEFHPEKLTLSPSQEKVASQIIKEGEGVFLLHGVTGSGKTEVYMKVVSDVLAKGKQAILLVPEISLTPQMTDRFFRRFGNNVAVIHSALSLGERFDEWRRIRRKEANVVIGARSAVFSPCENLGVIIIDEEHEQTYKSESSPRYHAREIALHLAKKHSCPLVLGSATPSVESYYKAKEGDYTLLELFERFNKKPLPEVCIADMRQELHEGNKTVLSRMLAYEIDKNIKNKEKTILFLNRRGYSTFVSCRDCGFVYTCPHCSVSLTYHKNTNSMICHYCGYQEEIKPLCPRCRGNRVRDFGKGTQKAQEQIESIFPNAGVLRMDADTTSGKRGHEKLLEQFSANDTDILLGTQMVTKGLDFDSVTLVGVLAADASLNTDDFRAQERTFNLITQVCGRAGRGEKPGRAVIQSYDPENPILLLAAKQDYRAFYEDEIIFRKTFCYPPFCDIVTVTISSSDNDEAFRISQNIALKIKVALRSYDNCAIYGPSPAPIRKMQDRYRYRIWFKCTADETLIQSLRDIIHEKRNNPKSDLSVIADINPLSVV